MRAGSPETGHADPSAPQSLETQAGRDVAPPKGGKAGDATTSDRPDGWGEGSGGAKPRKASTAGSPRGPGGSTDSPRVESPGGGRVAVAPRERRPPATSGGLGPREGHPPRRGERLEGQSPGTLRCGRAGRVGGEGREGGDQTPDVARGRRRDPPSLMRVHRPGTCRRAAKPRRGSTVRRSDAGCRWRHDGTVRGSDEPTSGGARKRKGGRPATSVADAGPAGWTRWASKRRTGRTEPMTVQAGGPESPERRETPGETA
jgi:hypothetical protein